jgi:hypothetical protein
MDPENPPVDPDTSGGSGGGCPGRSLHAARRNYNRVVSEPWDTRLRFEDDAMDNSLHRALVRTILEHAEDYPWTMQELGLLGLRLDRRREHRLHVWDPGSSVGDPPVHDHPFDFTSTVVAGEMTNTRYEEDPAGVEYHRVRYSPPNEDDRRADTVRLSGTASTFTAGAQYSQLAHELHDSRQVPGTVTIIRWTFKPAREPLTVCTRDAAWVSGQSRPATPDEVKRITGTALDLLD